MSTYPLLEQAPQDHESPEFLKFLRKNNVVVRETDNWLIIENCKYHSELHPWYTAFLLNPKATVDQHSMKELQGYYPGFHLILKAPNLRSVQRFHFHLTMQV